MNQKIILFIIGIMSLVSLGMNIWQYSSYNSFTKRLVSLGNQNQQLKEKLDLLKLESGCLQEGFEVVQWEEITFNLPHCLTIERGTDENDLKKMKLQFKVMPRDHVYAEIELEKIVIPPKGRVPPWEKIGKNYYYPFLSGPDPHSKDNEMLYGYELEQDSYKLTVITRTPRNPLVLNILSSIKFS